MNNSLAACFQVASLDLENEIVVPGSSSWEDHQLCVGTYEGELLQIDLGRREVTQRAQVAPKACLGTSVFSGSTTYLTQGKPICEDGNWDIQLVTLDAENERISRISLGVGRWRMAPVGRPIPFVLVCDSELEGGIQCFRADSLKRVWHWTGHSVKRVHLGADGFVHVLTDRNEIFQLGLENGTIQQRFSIPPPADAAEPRCLVWMEEGFYLLGGRLAEDPKVSAVFRVRPDGAEVVARTSFEDCFSSEVIENAVEDAEHCGFDLNSIVNLVNLGGGMVAFALGGDLACQSGTAIGVLNWNTKTVDSLQTVDEACGNSALTLLPGGHLLADCGGNLHLLVRLPT